LQSRLDKSALDAERANLALEQVTQELDRARAQLEDLERVNAELIGKVDQTTMALISTVEERDLAIQRLARLKQRRSVRIALRAADWTKPFIRKNSG
jgi:hypothetical protein